MRLPCLALTAVFALLTTATTARADIYYVDDDSTVASPNGSDWNDAFKYLQDALDVAGSGDTIKIASGYYRPDQHGGASPSNDPEETFGIPAGVTLEGGYAGLALPSTPNLRNIYIYITHLTGEINNTSIATDNSRRVVTILGDGVDTVLDGVEVEWGYADHDDDVGVGIAFEDTGATPTIRNCFIDLNTNIHSGSKGAGMVYVGDGSGLPDIRIENCEFHMNTANAGAAITFINASPVVRDSLIATNWADQFGGGLWIRAVDDGDSLATFTNCIIADNVAGWENTYGEGAGAYCNGGAHNGSTFRDCEFIGNIAYGAGGGLFVDHALVNLIGCNVNYNAAFSEAAPYGGGMYTLDTGLIINTTFCGNFTFMDFSPFTYDGYGGGLYADKSLPLIVNSVFHHNISGHGGGMYGDSFGGGPVNFVGINCTFADNYATVTGGGYEGYLSDEAPIAGFVNSIFWANEDEESMTVEQQQVSSNSPNVTYSCVMDGDPGNPPPFSSTNIDEDPMFRYPIALNYRLKRCSPAIDIASTPDIPEDFLNLDEDADSTCNGCDEFDTGERMPDRDFGDRVIDVGDASDGGVADSGCKRGCGVVADLGAYEFYEFSEHPCEKMGDVSGDGEVDGSDVFPFTTCVTMGISTGNCACRDMNGDGVVDADDVECFMQKVLKGESDCDGIVICEEGSSFTFYAVGGSNASGNASAEPITWSTVAAAGVAASVSACASQSSLLGTPENGDVDVFALALRWVAFETWVTAHPIESFAGSSDSYDAWAKLQFNRIVLEGKNP